MTVSSTEHKAEKALISPDAVALVQELHLRGTSSLILVGGPARVGKSAFVDEAIASRLVRFCHGHRTSRVPVQLDDTVSSVVKRCISAILNAHPVVARYQARNADAVDRRRESLLELAETAPDEAGKKLLSFIRGLEKNATDSLKDVALMLHIDGLERMFQNDLKPKTTVFPFLHEILGVKSLLLVVSHRDWIGKIITKALDSADFSTKEVVRESISWPKPSKISAVISRKVSDAVRNGKLNHDFSTNSPASFQHLAAVLSNADSTLSDHLSKTAEELYTSLSDAERGGVPRLFQRLSSTNAPLCAKEISKDPQLWHAANLLADHGILAFSGKSLKSAQFELISDSILRAWERAARWTGGSNAAKEAKEDVLVKTEVRLADQFENHALSWKTNDRNPDLLLHVDDSLVKARELLKQHGTKPILSPLAFEFLSESVYSAKSGIDRIKRFREIGIAAAAAIVVVAGLTAVIQHLTKTDPNSPTNTSADGLASAPAPAPVIAEEIEATTPATAVATAQPEPEAEPIPEIVAQPEPETAIDPELQALAQKIAGGLEIPLPDAEKETPETAITAPSKANTPNVTSPQSSEFHIPEGFTATSSQADIIAKVEAQVGSRQTEEALESMRFVFDRARHDPDAKPTSSELRKLIVNLGKIALQQRDQKAAQSAWKMGMNTSRSAKNPLPDDVRLLMARIAANADRSRDAATYLFGPSEAENYATQAQAILDLEFGSSNSSSTNVPKLDRKILKELPISERLKNQLEIDG